MNRICAGGFRRFALCLLGFGVPMLSSASSVNCVANVCDLGNLGGTKGSTASFINNAGDVTGTSYTSGNTTQQTFLYISGADTLVDVDSGTSFTSSPKGLNASGALSGSVDLSLGDQAFLYQNSSLSTLGTLSGGFVSYGNGLNDSNTVVGTSAGSAQIAFVSTSGTMTSLGTLGGTSSSADFINDAGAITGVSTTGGSQSYAFYLQSGTTLNGGACVQADTCAEITIGGDSTPQAMNANGQVVGSGYIGPSTSYNQHAFLYTPGTAPVDLETLDYSNGEYYGNSDALAVNDSGVVVGESDIASGSSQAFMYSNDVMTSLGTLDSLAYSTAVAVNDSDEIVGTASNASTIGTSTVLEPFIWVGGTMTNLNSLLPANSGFTSLQTATGINSSGQIIGEGITTSGAMDGYILDYTASDPPTPEPSTIVSMAAGLLWCAGMMRRSRGRNKRGCHHS